MERDGVELTLKTCILEVLRSNIGQITSYPERNFCRLPLKQKAINSSHVPLSSKLSSVPPSTLHSPGIVK
jgi:hypothetical protein